MHPARTDIEFTHKHQLYGVHTRTVHTHERYGVHTRTVHTYERILSHRLTVFVGTYIHERTYTCTACDVHTYIITAFVTCMHAHTQLL